MNRKTFIINEKNKLNSLTSFRFISALMVFIFHVGIFAQYQTGYLGVSFFFILSGFILAYNYKGKMTILNPSEIKRFYIARIAKVYPIHLLTFMMAVPYYFFIPLKHEPILYVFQAITNILLIHSFIPFGNISFNGVSWSLSDEIFFYGLFPFIIFLFIKYLKGKAMKLFLVIGLWITTLLLVMLLFVENNNFNTWFTYYFPGVRIIEFITGVLLGLLFIEINDTFVKRSKHIFTILEVTTIFLLVLMIIVGPNFNQNLRYSLIFLPFWASLIFIFSFEKGLISKLLSNKFFIYLGEISFSFYMIHNLVLSYILFLWKPNINQTLLIGVCFTITLTLSSLMYEYYEEPMRHRVRNYLNYKFREKSIEINHEKASNL